MGSLFSTNGLGGGGTTPKIQKSHTCKRKKSRTYKRIRRALERVGFKASLIDRHLKEVQREYRDYNSVDATKLVWLRWHSSLTSRLNPSLLEMLYSCAGIKRSAAVEYARTFGPVWTEGHLTFVQLLDYIIEYALGRYVPIRPKTSRFLLPIDHARLTSLTRPRGELKNLSVLHANVLTNDLASAVIDYIKVPPNCELLYHATNWSGAVDMTNDRPLAGIGRPCLDFGKMPSFYTTPSLPTALAWAQNRRASWSDECAIVVFTTPNTRLQEISFASPDHEWARLTRDSRSCSPLPRRNSLDKVDIVRGPMVANAEAVASRNAMPKTHKPLLFQVAVKSAAAEQMMADSLAAVLWLSKN